MSLVYLARHGETDWNLAGRYQGRRESTLTQLGRRQAQALAEHFLAQSQSGATRIARVVSSPLGRCRATAQPVADALGLPLDTDERLIEIAHGTWEGLLRDEIATIDPERWLEWREHPGRPWFSTAANRWKMFARAGAPLRPDHLTSIRSSSRMTRSIRVALLDVQELPLEQFWNVPFENGA